MDNFLELFCVICLSMSQPPLPQMSRPVGDIRYTHERLSGGKHLLRLSTTDFIIDGDAWRERRLVAFASNFAAQTCGGASFRLDEATRPSWPRVRPVYAKQYLFSCVPVTLVRRG